MNRVHPTFIVVVWLLLMCRPGLGQDTGFNSFFATFQSAVEQKDQAALSRMMAPSFDFFQARAVSHGQVFSHLDAENGKQWANLQHATHGSIVQHPYDGRPAHMLQCTPTNDIYRCLVVFQQDAHHHWQWKGMVMPLRSRH
jgi:hypothetical protein